jgi:hypothetical protein
MIINNEIKQRFDLLLDRLHLTQGQLSLKMGFSNGNGLSMITRGKNELNERHLLILESTLNVNKDWLVTGNGPMFIKSEEANGKRNIVHERSEVYNAEKVVTLSNQEIISRLVLQNEKLIQIIERHSITIENLSHRGTADLKVKEKEPKKV